MSYLFSPSTWVSGQKCLLNKHTKDICAQAHKGQKKSCERCNMRPTYKTANSLSPLPFFYLILVPVALSLSRPLLLTSPILSFHPTPGHASFHPLQPPPALRPSLLPTHLPPRTRGRVWVVEVVADQAEAWLGPSRSRQPPTARPLSHLPHQILSLGGPQGSGGWNTLVHKRHELLLCKAVSRPFRFQIPIPQVLTRNRFPHVTGESGSLTKAYPGTVHVMSTRTILPVRTTPKLRTHGTQSQKLTSSGTQNPKLI